MKLSLDSSVVTVPNEMIEVFMESLLANEAKNPFWRFASGRIVQGDVFSMIDGINPQY